MASKYRPMSYDLIIDTVVKHEKLRVRASKFSSNDNAVSVQYYFTIEVV